MAITTTSMPPKSAYDPWNPTYSLTPKNHHINVIDARKYETEWRNFVSDYERLLNTPKWNLWTIFCLMNKLKKYKLIYYETFIIKDNKDLKDKLRRIIDEAAHLHIVHGMHKAHKDFADKDFMNNATLVARDHQGKVIETI